jgi:uncharacterized protein YecE (DUF72 family)
VPVQTYAEYARQVPTDFRFLVKAPMICTTPYFHEQSGYGPGRNLRFLDGTYAADVFVGPCLAGLGEKAGPLVFQFPPLGRGVASASACLPERLARFLEGLPAGPLYAVELRDRELLVPELLRVLANGGARLCIGIHPRMPSVVEQGRWLSSLPPGPLVVRWNLHAGLGYEQARARYFPFDRLVDEDATTRAAIGDLCVRVLAEGQAAFVIVNNKAEGSAPLSIHKLAETIASAT